MGLGTWTRRGFLAGSGVAAGGMVLGVGCTSSDTDAVEHDNAGGQEGNEPPFDPGDWDSVRAQFRLTPDKRHFAAFVLAAHPRPVADAIAQFRDALDVDTDEARHELSVREGDGRKAAAEYLGAAPGEIALTDSTTMGLGLVYAGMRLEPGDEVVTTEHDFFSTHEALRLRTERDGTIVRRVALYDEPSAASVDEIVTRLIAAIGPATRALAVTWVHSSTGVKLPIAAIAQALADVNADRAEPDRVLLCVDGVHGFGLEDVTVEDLGCDFLISGTHKWLFGPRGTGLVWGRPSAWARVVPIIPPFNWENTPGELASPGGYHSFEHRWALAAAFGFHADIGKAAINERTRDQATALKEGLAEIAGVEVVTPLSPELSAGIVCVRVGSQEPSELTFALRESDIIASVTPYATSYLRFGPSMVTTPEDVDAAVDAVADLAR